MAKMYMYICEQFDPCSGYLSSRFLSAAKLNGLPCGAADDSLFFALIDGLSPSAIGSVFGVMLHCSMA